MIPGPIEGLKQQSTGEEATGTEIKSAAVKIIAA